MKTMWEKNEEERIAYKQLFAEKQKQIRAKKMAGKIRNAKIVNWRKKKWTFSKIAKKYGITRQRVEQIYKENNMLK